jgi:NitT/TauT family transport system substrate-binding protein
MKSKTLVAAMALALGMGAAHAEVAEVTLAYQFGWSYTTLRAMEKQNLVEKHAKAAGIDVKANYKNMGTPAVIRDGMLAGQVNFGAVGVPTLITLADKTNGEFKALGNIVSVPMNFNVNVSANVTNLCEMKGKIALPTVKSSVQAVTLQMAAKQKCGDPFKLDANTVSMTHPDAMSALLNGQVDAHLTSPPFNDLEVSEARRDGHGRAGASRRAPSADT